MVEELVRRRDGPHDVVVDLAVLDRLEDRVAGLAEAPLAPPDEKRALRVRMEPAHLGEELAAARIIDLLPREHDGDVVAALAKLREPIARLRGRRRADDVVVPGIPVEELALDSGEPGRVGVDSEDDGVRHAPRIGRASCGHGSVDTRRVVGSAVLRRRRQPIA